MKLLIGIVFVAVIFSLGSALYHMTSRKSDSAQVTRAFGWRVALSALLIVLLLISWKYGLIDSSVRAVDEPVPFQMAEGHFGRRAAQQHRIDDGGVRRVGRNRLAGSSGTTGSAAASNEDIHQPTVRSAGVAALVNSCLWRVPKLPSHWRRPIGVLDLSSTQWIS